jgi:Asp-tRNA(Asn)/Glu-tRNA(Gln) amidotransferase A subunit family amidase
MPVGVQILAPATGEPTMFRAAAVLEAAAPAGHPAVGGMTVGPAGGSAT